MIKAHNLILFISILSLSINTSKAQDVPYHLDNEVVYDFIDELANLNIIDVNTCVKPYSRKQIAFFLQEAEQSNKLTKRQKKEIAFYLKDFNKELHIGKDFDKRFDIFYHSDSLFKFSINAIAGGRGYYNSNGFVQHRWNGAEFFGTIGKHLAIYGSLRDNHESGAIGGPEYLTRHRGAVYKLGANKKDYSESRGGIVYSWNWGNIGLIKDHIAWGNNYNGSNIISGHNPSVAHLKLNIKPVKWFELNYTHGWLVSEVVDSARSYSHYEDTRRVFQNKFIAANLMTFKPWKKLNLSIGNSIIYSDGNVNPAFMIPFLFYKSVDHTYNASRNSAGHNAQMFFDISSRQINKLHLYTSVFIDEIALSNMFDKDEHSNHISIKVGARATNLLPDLSLTAEYTRSNPFTYTHFIPSLTYESNRYTLGHYLKDNSDEVYLSARYKPVRGLDILVSMTHARRGRDNQKILDENEESTNLWGDDRKGFPFMEEARYDKTSFKIRALYQIINDAYIFTELETYTLSGDDAELYTPLPYLNDDKMFVFGLNFGF
ncbi:hypothetical protein E9993_03090 [Labilibacter sediminis]|nr:hypothetical protein E9993_03090 [Labilibacter sediminis]